MTSAPQTQTPPLAIATGEEIWLLRWFMRLRWIFFAIVVATLLAGHNGQWRVGRDSALYREVARNLAHGNGYTYRGERERHIYPGLPLLLAAVEKIAGPQDPLRPRAALLLMLALSFATLIVIFQMTRLQLPRWIALCVTTGVGVNLLFNEQAHELMTDMPFLLGICLLFLGVAMLQMPDRRLARIIPVLIVGAFLALSMRPTFWAFALAGVGAMILRLIDRSHAPADKREFDIRLLFCIAIPVLLIPVVLVVSRVTGIGSKYLQVVYQHLGNLSGVDWPKRCQRLFAIHFPEGLFGFEMPLWLGILFTVAILASAAIRIRRRPLASLYILATFAMMLLLGSTPRYFLMILPFLLTEWALLVHDAAKLIGRYIPWRFTPDWVLLVGLSFATVGQVGQTFYLILEQHGRTLVIGNTKGGRHGGIRDFRTSDVHIEKDKFLNVYRSGKMAPVVALADAIRKATPTDANILAPEPRILTFLTGRRVYDPADLLAVHRKVPWTKVVSGNWLTWCAWGPRFSDELRILQVLRKRLIEVEVGTIILVEPVGRVPRTRERTGVFLARTRPRTPGKRPNRQVIAPQSLPGLDPSLYGTKVHRPALRHPTTAKTPATQPISKPPATRRAKGPGAKPATTQPAPKTRPSRLPRTATSQATQPI